MIRGDGIHIAVVACAIRRRHIESMVLMSVKVSFCYKKMIP